MFAKIAPYLKDPLILIGFFLFVSFLFLRSLVTKGIIPTLARGQGFKILKIILLYGFIIGLCLIGLGFGLKYKELSKGEQKNIVGMLSKELDGNISVIGELKRNTETFLNQQIMLSQLLRTKGIKILPVMFPQENLNLDKSVNTNDLARQAFLNLIRTGLATNRTEGQKLDEFSKALLKTINSVKNTNESLRDSIRKRYKFTSEVWQSNLLAYKKVNIIDITLFQKAYVQQDNIRNDYEIVAKATINFENSLLEYFKTDNELTWDKLAYVLSLERNSYELIVEYSKNLVNTMTDLNDMKTNLNKNIALL